MYKIIVDSVDVSVQYLRDQGNETFLIPRYELNPEIRTHLELLGYREESYHPYSYWVHESFQEWDNLSYMFSCCPWEDEWWWVARLDEEVVLSKRNVEKIDLFFNEEEGIAQHLEGKVKEKGFEKTPRGWFLYSDQEEAVNEVVLEARMGLRYISSNGLTGESIRVVDKYLVAHGYHFLGAEWSLKL